jgi:hypothetical protein
MASEISKIVPVKSRIDADKVSIYEIDDSGAVNILSNYNGIPSDDNYLNNLLAEANDFYAGLQEIEEENEN